jgi:hypothetical protein
LAPALPADISGDVVQRVVPGRLILWNSLDFLSHAPYGDSDPSLSVGNGEVPSPLVQKPTQIGHAKPAMASGRPKYSDLALICPGTQGRVVNAEKLTCGLQRQPLTALSVIIAHRQFDMYLRQSVLSIWDKVIAHVSVLTSFFKRSLTAP